MGTECVTLIVVSGVKKLLVSVVPALALFTVACQPPGPPAPPDRCGSALAAVQASGLGVPPGFAFFCPGSAQDTDGSIHEGLTSWVAGCPSQTHVPGQGCYVDVNPSRVSSDSHLRHVVAHELCHAWQLSSGGWTTEAYADWCAAEWGF